MKTIRAGWKQKLHSESYSKSFTVKRGLAVGACDLRNCSWSLFWNVLTLKVASAQVIETSVANNSPSQDSNHPDDDFQSRYVTPGFKSFSYIVVLIRSNVRKLKVCAMPILACSTYENPTLKAWLN